MVDKRRAAELQAVLDEVKVKLPGYFTKGHEIEFLLDGPIASIRYGEDAFARKEGVLVVVRDRGGRIETATVDQGGFGSWMPSAPLEPGSN